MAHLDANWRKSGDLRVGGLVNSAPLRAELLHEADHHREEGELGEATEFEGLAALSGRIPNSATRSRTLGAGFAFIDEGGNLGISIQRQDSRYGVPSRPGAGHAHGEGEGEGEAEHGEEAVAIDLGQTRIDLRGGIGLSGVFQSLQLRGAYGDYRHIEFEGTEEGTVFSGQGTEFRADLIQADRGGWKGQTGVQWSARKLTVMGPEAFVPPYEVTRFGVFTMQSLALGDGLSLEGAGRYERATVRANALSYHRGFDLFSGAAGLSYAPAEGWKIGVNYIRGARAPAPEELLSDGMHVATQSYELGDPGFGVERSNGFEAYVKYAGERAELSLTTYQTDFRNFIAALPDGTEIEGLPVFRYAQMPARFRGFELAGSLKAMQWKDGELRIDGGADYTRARLKGAGPLPRIPPLRLRGGAELRSGDLRLRGEVEWNRRQDRVATFENPVPGFTLVNLSADWHPMGEEGPITLILSADNLFDVVGRRAASFTRDFVPLSGRDIRLTVKFSL